MKVKYATTATAIERPNQSHALPSNENNAMQPLTTMPTTSIDNTNESPAGKVINKVSSNNALMLPKLIVLYFIARSTQLKIKPIKNKPTGISKIYNGCSKSKIEKW